MTIIKREDIRKGDKIRVTYTINDLEISKTGVAHNYSITYGDWATVDYNYLSVVANGAVIELLERPKTAEELAKEILAERREKLAEYFTAPMRHGYTTCTLATQRAINKIIELEDKLEEKEDNSL